MAARLGFQIPQLATLPHMRSLLWISIRKWKIYKRYIYQRVSQFQNPLFFGILILGKEEQILSLKLGDFIPKIKGRLANQVL